MRGSEWNVCETKNPILAEMRKKFPKWISNGTPMMPHDSNDTLFPRCGHTSFEISMRQENPILAEMRKKVAKWISNGTPMMSHDSNDTLFPWYGHTSFLISVRQEIPFSRNPQNTTMHMMHIKFLKWISNGTPMMSHDFNDTLLPWHEHTSSEISVRQKIPF